MTTDAIRARLEELRVVLRSESMSYGELIELQGLAEHIEPGDVELLEAAGVPEFPEDTATTPPTLTPETQAKYEERKANGERIIRAAWGRKVHEDDREIAAKDAISDVLTALLGPAGATTFDAHGDNAQVKRNEYLCNEAARILYWAQESWQGDAEDYYTA